MKSKFKPFFLLMATALLSSCSLLSKETNPLAGTKWEFSESEGSGTTLRTLRFSENGEFMTSAPTNSGERLYNAGEYTILNDSTFLTVHDKQTTANYYNFEIVNDTLHFYGNYIRPNANNTTAKMSYIKEMWVRSEE